MHRQLRWWGTLAMGVAVAVGQPVTGQDAPTPAAVERAHQLFNGTW